VVLEKEADQLDRLCEKTGTTERNQGRKEHPVDNKTKYG